MGSAFNGQGMITHQRMYCSLNDKLAMRVVVSRQHCANVTISSTELLTVVAASCCCCRISPAVIYIRIVTRLRGRSTATDWRSNHGKKGDASVCTDRVSDDECLEQRPGPGTDGGEGVASDSAQQHILLRLCPSWSVWRRYPIDEMQYRLQSHVCLVVCASTASGGVHHEYHRQDSCPIPHSQLTYCTELLTSVKLNTVRTDVSFFENHCRSDVLLLSHQLTFSPLTTATIATQFKVLWSLQQHRYMMPLRFLSQCDECEHADD